MTDGPCPWCGIPSSEWIYGSPDSQPIETYACWTEKQYASESTRTDACLLIESLKAENERLTNKENTP